MKYLFCALFLLATLVAAAGCGPAPSEVKLTDQDNGSQVNLRPGQNLIVELAANPTTGYEWALAADPDAAVLKVLGHEYKAPASSRVGAGGTDTWRFQAAGSGQVTLKLVYRRPWDEQDMASDFSVNVIVE
jgi:inhibitor of cysteine peptidase